MTGKWRYSLTSNWVLLNGLGLKSKVFLFQFGAIWEIWLSSSIAKQGICDWSDRNFKLKIFLKDLVFSIFYFNLLWFGCLSLRKKCPYSELFWSAFFSRLFADQNNPEYEHFLRRAYQSSNVKTCIVKRRLSDCPGKGGTVTSLSNRKVSSYEISFNIVKGFLLHVSTTWQMWPLEVVIKNYLWESK